MSNTPWPAPKEFKNAAHRGWIEKQAPDFSDGDERHWPAKPKYRPSDDRNYLCRLATELAVKDGTAQPGFGYYLRRLPSGYGCFETDQPGGSQTYKRLFGHPSGRFFDSIARFNVHYLWMISGMQGTCDCVLCSLGKPKPSTSRPRIPRDHVVQTPVSEPRSRDDSSSRSDSAEGLALGRSQRRRRQADLPYAFDEEGTEDIWKDCVKRSFNNRGSKHAIQIDIEEPNSIDWKAERENLPQYLTQIEQQHSFIPRVGELVLWYPDFPEDHYLMHDPKSGGYKFYSFNGKHFRGYPKWRGGIVASVPSAATQNGPVDFPDILDVPQKKTALNTAGFRIETMPDPNEDIDKSSNKQYRYIPLRNIRPLSQWQLLLKGAPAGRLDPSVFYALTCMTSLSLLEKWRFDGDWPLGCIFAKGIYLGSELITVGDTVRIVPALADSARSKANPKCTDVLCVTSIRFLLDDCEPKHAESSSKDLSKVCFVTLVGNAYTPDLRRAHEALNPAGSTAIQQVPSRLSREAVKTQFRCVGTDEYGSWYPLHPSTQKYEVSYDQVLGRMYEADAVRLWSGQRQQLSDGKERPPADLTFDTKSILVGRKYATRADARTPEIKDADITWFMADNRAEGLAIATLNGQEVSKYHEVRTPATLKYWRANLKVAEGARIEGDLLRDLQVSQAAPRGLQPGSETSTTSGTGRPRGRPAGSKVVDGRLYFPGELVEKSLQGHADQPVLMPRAKAKSSSHMADAALASTDEEDLESDDGDVGIATQPAESTGSTLSMPIRSSMALSGPEDNRRRPSFDQAPKQPRTKAEIMASYDEIEEDSEESEEDDWTNPRHARGGTEESEGGDYDPSSI